MKKFEVIYEIEFKNTIISFSAWVPANTQDEACMLADTRPDLFMTSAFRKLSKAEVKSLNTAYTAALKAVE